MGLFSDRCTNVQCDQRVRKGSQFCPKCGAPAPKGLTKCGRCGSEVRTSSKFCWKCGANTADMAKPPVLGDRWVRSSDDFAVRIDEQDVKGWLTKPLTIEHGTRAMLFQGGRLKGELHEGRHDMGGFLKTLNHFMIDQAAAVVLIDAGDVSIELRTGELWTEDKYEVESVERIVLRIKDADSMFVNLFKSCNRVRLSDLEAELADEVQMLLAGLVGRYRVEELFSNLELRNELETRLRDTLSATLERLGLELAQLRFVKFACEAYEEIRRKQAEIAAGEARTDVAEDRVKLNRRIREALTQDKMDAFKSANDFEQFVRQTEHEMGLKEVIRQDEMDVLKERFNFERDREKILRRIEIMGIENDARREEAWKALTADEDMLDERRRRELERRIKDAKSEIDVRKAQIDLDDYEAKLGIDRLMRMKDMEFLEDQRAQKLEEEKLKVRGQATVEALLSIVDGPAADRIVQLEELRRREKMSPEQILALAAGASPEAARTLAHRYEADGQLSAERAKLLEKQLADQRQTYESFADRTERLIKISLEQMGMVAGVREKKNYEGHEGHEEARRKEKD